MTVNSDMASYGGSSGNGQRSVGNYQQRHNRHAQFTQHHPQQQPLGRMVASGSSYDSHHADHHHQQHQMQQQQQHQQQNEVDQVVVDEEAPQRIHPEQDYVRIYVEPFLAMFFEQADIMKHAVYTNNSYRGIVVNEGSKSTHYNFHGIERIEHSYKDPRFAYQATIRYRSHYSTSYNFILIVEGDCILNGKSGSFKTTMISQQLIDMSQLIDVELIEFFLHDKSPNQNVRDSPLSVSRGTPSELDSNKIYRANNVHSDVRYDHPKYTVQQQRHHDVSYSADDHETYRVVNKVESMSVTKTSALEGDLDSNRVASPVEHQKAPIGSVYYAGSDRDGIKTPQEISRGVSRSEMTEPVSEESQTELKGVGVYSKLLIGNKNTEIKKPMKSQLPPSNTIAANVAPSAESKSAYAKSNAASANRGLNRPSKNLGQNEGDSKSLASGTGRQYQRQKDGQSDSRAPARYNNARTQQYNEVAIHVSNIPANVTDESLKDCFKAFKVVKAIVNKGKHDLGTVVFESAEERDKVLPEKVTCLGQLLKIEKKKGYSGGGFRQNHRPKPAAAASGSASTSPNAGAPRQTRGEVNPNSKPKDM
ncbi:MAG: hypothetical protein MHMPM18_001789 [Marteilia pararefringens]